VAAQPLDDEARLKRLGELVLARDWRPEEKAILARQLESFRATYQSQPESAAALIAVGESKPMAELPPAEVAAWMLVASTAFNLDATLNK
jgi:hypothetical protein